MPQLDISTFASQLFWLMISFFALLAITYFIIVPKMDAISRNRSGYLDSILDKASNLRDGGQKINEHVDKSLETATLQIKISEENAIADLTDKAEKMTEDLSERNTRKSVKAMDKIKLAQQEAEKTIIEGLPELVSAAFERMYGKGK